LAPWHASNVSFPSSQIGSRESQNFSSTRDYTITEKQEKVQMRNKDNIK